MENYVRSCPELFDSILPELKESEVHSANISLHIRVPQSSRTALGHCPGHVAHFNPRVASYASMHQIASGRVKMYAVLGWFSPVIIEGKILLQKLWDVKTSWDEKVPSHIQEHWNECLTTYFILT